MDHKLIDDITDYTGRVHASVTFSRRPAPGVQRQRVTLPDIHGDTVEVADALRELADRLSPRAGDEPSVDRADNVEAKLDRVRALAGDLLREFTANIPLGPTDPEWDPNDEFRRCAIDRRDRVKRWHDALLEVLNGDAMSPRAGDEPSVDTVSAPPLPDVLIVVADTSKDMSVIYDRLSEIRNHCTIVMVTYETVQSLRRRVSPHARVAVINAAVSYLITRYLRRVLKEVGVDYDIATEWGSALLDHYDRKPAGDEPSADADDAPDEIDAPADDGSRYTHVIIAEDHADARAYASKLSASYSDILFVTMREEAEQITGTPGVRYAVHVVWSSEPLYIAALIARVDNRFASLALPDIHAARSIAVKLRGL